MTQFNAKGLVCFPDISGDVVGDISATRVTALNGQQVQSGVPTTGFGLVWNGTSWTYAVPPAPCVLNMGNLTSDYVMTGNEYWNCVNCNGHALTLPIGVASNTMMFIIKSGVINPTYGYNISTRTQVGPGDGGSPSSFPVLLHTLDGNNWICFMNA